ncbi:MAG: CHAD domain-containing protein, partial [Anaerolineales bacterium]|nr:CHAD domain-containing protein [Anaerolineales bacterium]
LLEAIDNRWQTYREQIKTCRREFSEEAVHDLRVAARRLLALVDLIRAIAPHPRLQKIRKALKGQLDEFDGLRDTQVMLAEVSENLETLPELKPIRQILQKRERRFLREAEEIIEDLKPAGIARRLEKTRAMIAQVQAGPAFDALVLQAVDEAYGTVLQRYAWIHASQPATIHRTRIAFKRFRYMVEIIHPLLPDFPRTNFKRMHDYQTAMGEIQDAEVFLFTLEEMTEIEGIEVIRRHYEQRHQQLIAVFMEEKSQVETFWRPAPEQPFPWQVIQPAETKALSPS